MPMPNAADVAKKWAKNLTGATDTIRAGVQNTQINPMERAADRAEAYVEGTRRAVEEGRFQKRLRMTPMEFWRQSVLQKGLPRIAAGAQQALPRVQTFMEEFLPWVQQGVDRLQQMPRGDLQSNIQRAVAMMEHNARFRGQGRGR